MTLFSHIYLPASGIWSFKLERRFLFAFAPNVGVILGWDIEGNLSSSKGVTIDNFHISDGVMKYGHLSSQTWLSKLKSNSLQGKKWFVFVQFFIIFFEFGFLDSCLNLIEFFKCMTWQSIFLLFFFSFSFDLSTPGNDACYR